MNQQHQTLQQITEGNYQFTFILPTYTPEGHWKEDTLEDLEDELVDAYHWVMTKECSTFFCKDDEAYSDPAREFTVLSGNTVRHYEKLIRLIKKYGKLLDQPFVWVKYPSGSCGFLNIDN